MLCKYQNLTKISGKLNAVDIQSVNSIIVACFNSVCNTVYSSRAC